MLYAYERFKARPTLDIDFMGHNIDRDKDKIVDAFKSICDIEFPEDGVTFHTETIRTSDIAIEKRYPGVRITLTVSLDSILQDISMDIGFGDIITPAPAELDYPAFLDFNRDISVMAYSIETVIAEKLQTAIERGVANSRMKDFYDLYTLLNRDEYNPTLLNEAIQATFSNRKTLIDKQIAFFTKDFGSDAGLNQRWSAFIRKLRPDRQLSFSEVITSIQSLLANVLKF